MFPPDSAPSSSSSGLNAEAGDYQRIADVLERRLAGTLTRDLSNAVTSALIVEASRWFAHLESSLHRLEEAFKDQPNIGLPPLVATNGETLGTSLASSTSPHSWRESARERVEGQSCEAPGLCIGRSSEISSECGDESGTDKGSSLASLTPPLWLRPSNSSARRPKARRAPARAMDIASLEQRLAGDIFQDRLGNSIGSDGSISEALDHRSEPGLTSTWVRQVSVAPTVHPNFVTADIPVSRTSSLRATRCSSFAPPDSHIDIEMHAGQAMSSMSCGSPMSCASPMSLGSLQSKQWGSATVGFYEDEILVELSSAPMRLFVKCLPLLFGMLPWNPRYKWLSRLYQAAVLLVSMCTALTVSLRLKGGLEGVNEELLVAFFEIVLGFGSVAGLCGYLVQNKKIANATTLAERYAGRANMCYSWDKKSSKDTSFILILVVACIGLEYLPCWFGGQAEFDGAIVFLEVILLALCYPILRLIRFLGIAVEVYCNRVVDREEFADAVEEWRLLHATCRAVCESIQVSFVILQSVALGTLLIVLLGDIRQIQTTLLLPHIVQGLLCAWMISTLPLYAASLTQKCDMVPILVNSASTGNIDPNRMYLVDYISKSRTGFYLFDLKLNSGGVLRAFYFAYLGALSLTSGSLSISP